MIALIQRPRRKRHLAVVLPGATRWETLGSCRLTVPLDGTDFTLLDTTPSVGTAVGQDVDVCLHCLHLIAFAHLLEQRPELLTGLQSPRHLTAVAS